MIDTTTSNLRISTLLNSNQTEFFDTPTGIETTNQYGALPYTPQSSNVINNIATPGSPSFGEFVGVSTIDNGVFHAQLQREEAISALKSVTKILEKSKTPKSKGKSRFSSPLAALQNLTATTTDSQSQAVSDTYQRLSPGHFLLHNHANATLDSGFSSPLSTTAATTPIARSASTSRLRSSSKSTPISPSTHTKAIDVAMKLTELQDRHTKLLGDCERAETAAFLAMKEKEKAEHDVDAAAQRVKELTTTIDQLRNEKEACQGQVSDLNSTLGQLRTEIEAQEVALKDRQAACERADEEYSLLSMDITEAQAELDVLKHQLKEMEEAERLQTSLDELKQQIAEETYHLASLQQQQRDANAALIDADEHAVALKISTDELKNIESLSLEAEAIYEEKKARVAAAQRDWERAEERLGQVESELVETAARLEARRQLLAETEEKCALGKCEMMDLAERVHALDNEKKEAECMLEKVQKELEEKRFLENEAEKRAFEAGKRAFEAEEHAMEAEERAVIEELRVQHAVNQAHELEGMYMTMNEAEHRLLELRAEIAEAEVASMLKKKVQELVEEREALQEQLFVEVAAREEAQRAQQAQHDVSAALEEEQAKTVALTSQLISSKAEIEKERQARKEAEEKCSATDMALKQAMAEVDRLTHHHHALRESKLLEAEVTDISFRAEQLQKQLTAANQRADAAEAKLRASQDEILSAVEERDEALDRSRALSTARDAAVKDLACVETELAHRNAMHAELKEHTAQLGRMLSIARSEKSDAKNLNASLQLQIESLQDRLNRESVRRAMDVAAIEATKKLDGVDNDAMYGELEKKVGMLTKQNTALRSTASRLSQALARLLKHGGKSGAVPFMGTEDSDDIGSIIMDGGNHNVLIPAQHSKHSTESSGGGRGDTGNTNNAVVSHKKISASTATLDVDDGLTKLLNQLKAVESLLD